MARRRQAEAKKGAPEWMTTYGDMVTLLLCFFVLLFSFSEIDAKKFEAIIESFSGSLGVLTSGKVIEDNEVVSDDRLPEQNVTLEMIERENFEALYRQLEAYIETLSISDKIELNLTEIGLLVRLYDNALFDSGSAEINMSGIEVLHELGRIFKNLNKYIRVEGHSDSIPILNSRFRSNWDLSAARAASVIHYFNQEIGIDLNFFVLKAYAENYPIADNSTPEGRAMNRRVDLVILRDKYKPAPYY